jgi:2-polyprenyl-3-methyl-5-hydroxy-6-metoxy-1,4-benzoquinol methylase
VSSKVASAATNHGGDASASAELRPDGRCATEELYKDGTYLELNPTWHVEDSPWKAKQIRKIIERNRLQPKSICEIGCGAGEVTHQLQLLLRGNCSFVGYEISPQAFGLCKKRENPGLQFHLGDLLQEQEAYFDLVLAIDVFEHVEEYFGFLRQLRKKGKYKVFHIPLDLSVQSVLRASPILRFRRTLGHIHYFTKETALAALADTGYEVQDYFYTSHSIDMPARSFKAGLARVPRKILYKVNSGLTVRLFGGFSLMVLAQ